jgi:hypothetical protein
MHFIITSGPVGSGKTSIIQATLAHLGLAGHYEKFLIDDLVENDAEYKSLVTGIISKIDAACARKHTDSDAIVACKRNAFVYPTPKLFKAFSDAYFLVRRQTGCKRTKKGETFDGNCDEFLKIQLKLVKQKQPPIVVFETTGASIPDWLLSADWIPDNYKIVVSYALASIPALIDRNKMRAYNGVLEFVNDPRSAPAPRLPDVRANAIKQSVDVITGILRTLYEKCICAHDHICGTRTIDTLLIFDTNTVRRLAFDSAAQKLSPKAFGQVIDDILCGPLKKVSATSSKKVSKKSTQTPIKRVSKKVSKKSTQTPSKKVSKKSTQTPSKKSSKKSRKK